jgi:predicted nucleic acid-binding protein
VIVGDSSYFVALADRRDRWHTDAVRIRRTVTQEFLVADFVVAEVVTIVGNRQGGKTAQILDEYFVDETEVAFVDGRLLDEAMALHLRYDGRLSAADCVSVALMGREGIRDIVSFDSDFDRVRGIRRIR